MSHRAPSEHTPNLPPPRVVASPSQLEALLDELSAQSAIGVDTESNSLYAYHERVCLIQCSIPGADYIVDPLAGLDLSPLARVFADPGGQKVFHAAEYDVMCLKRDFGFRFANLFDTMWAARILGWPRVGLGDVLKETFGVRTNISMMPCTMTTSSPVPGDARLAARATSDAGTAKVKGHSRETVLDESSANIPGSLSKNANIDLVSMRPATSAVMAPAAKSRCFVSSTVSLSACAAGSSCEITR